MPSDLHLDPTTVSIQVVGLEHVELECFVEEVVIGIGCCIGEQDCHTVEVAVHIAVVVVVDRIDVVEEVHRKAVHTAEE